MTNFVTTSSAEVQPIAATKYFISVFPNNRVITKCKPTRSNMSTVFFRNSYKYFNIILFKKINLLTVFTTNNEDSSTGGKQVAIVSILTNCTKR